MRKLLKAKGFHIAREINHTYHALLMENGVIRKLYTKGEPLPPDTQVTDLEDAVVYPGFVDTHTHCFEGGLYANGVDLYPARSIADVLEMLSAAVAAHSEAHEIFCWHFDETLIKEQRFPTLKELDKVAGSKDIVLRRIDGHSCILNSSARAKIAELKDYREEVCRGRANDRAVHYFHNNCSEPVILAAYHKAAEIARKGGFTTIHTMIGDAENSIGHYALIARHQEQFPLRYILYPQSFDIKAALDNGAERIGGCILADGSIGSHTAALSQAYLDSPQSIGILYQSDAFWQDFIGTAHQHDLQVAVHCIGDRAIRQINNVYSNLQQTSPKDLRHQLIHCELTPDDLLQQISQSKACAVMQPAFDMYWGSENGLYQTKLGSQRRLQMNRFRSLSDLGVRVCGGSDWYITELDALQGIFAAINHHNPAEALTAEQAIGIYTENAAFLAHQEHLYGKIEVGMQADFTILNQSIREGRDAQNTKIIATIHNGEMLL